jgi:tetratricopeptide (TPR) repeat protein
MVYYTRTARRQGLHLLHQALAILEEEGESEELARVVSEIARTHMLASQYDQATAWGERAFKLAHDLGVEDVLVHSMTTLGVTYMSLGDVNRGLPMLQESLLRALDLGLVSNICRAYVNLGNILMAYARYPEAQEAWQALLSYATRIQSPAYAEIAMIYSSWIDWLTGKWQVAIERSWSLVESIFHESTPQPLEWKIWTATLTGQILNDLGQSEKASVLMERWMPLARQDTELQGFLPYLSELLMAYIASGKDDQANIILQEWLEWFERSPYFYVNSIQLIPVACQWLARRGIRYVDQIEICIRWLEKGDQQFHTAETAACVHEAWGCLLLAQSDDHGAGERFKQAAARWGEIQRPYDQLRAWNGLIPILHRQHQDAEEQEMLFQARQVVHSLASQLVDPEMKASLLRRFSAMGILA